jgi:hypothetical protein
VGVVNFEVSGQLGFGRGVESKQSGAPIRNTDGSHHGLRVASPHCGPQAENHFVAPLQLHFSHRFRVHGRLCPKLHQFRVDVGPCGIDADAKLLRDLAIARSSLAETEGADPTFCDHFVFSGVARAFRL